MICRQMHRLTLIAVVLGLFAVGLRAMPQQSLPDHHVFVQGSPVAVRVPGTVPAEARWECRDVFGKLEKSGILSVDAKQLPLGILPVGWYRVTFGEEADALPWTSAAVVARREHDIREDSPVCVDSATAWFARNNADKQIAFSQLAALANVCWIRDRMSWAALQTAPDQFADDTTYDTSADAEHNAGLDVLQVFHSTPQWAASAELDGEKAWKRFPRDLRHLARFCQHVATRFNGKVNAWEPWNEANIAGFGGHTIDEMITLQKAAYLALKKADPQLTVCWNVFAGAPGEKQAELLLANNSAAYFDTFNIHSYSKPEQYLEQFRYARPTACGKPIWLSECGIRLKTDGRQTMGRSHSGGRDVPGPICRTLVCEQSFCGR